MSTRCGSPSRLRTKNSAFSSLWLTRTVLPSFAPWMWKCGRVGMKSSVVPLSVRPSRKWATTRFFGFTASLPRRSRAFPAEWVGRAGDPGPEVIGRIREALERVVALTALHDRHVAALRRPRIDLARAADLEVRVAAHLEPLGDPPGHPPDREHDREHVLGNTERLV